MVTLAPNSTLTWQVRPGAAWVGPVGGGVDEGFGLPGDGVVGAAAAVELDLRAEASSAVAAGGAYPQRRHCVADRRGAGGVERLGHRLAGASQQRRRPHAASEHAGTAQLPLGAAQHRLAVGHSRSLVVRGRR